MNKISQMLKDEREKKGLSLHEIGMILKINPKILKAIEDNDTNQLPAKTFLRGFIKAYAQFLKLDVDSILNLFQEEYGSTKPETPAQIANQPSINSTGQTPAESVVPAKMANSDTPIKKLDSSVIPQDNKNKTYTVISGIVLLIIIAFVAKMMDKYQKESTISQDEVLSAVGSTTTITIPTTSDSGALSTPVDSSTTTTTLAPLNEIINSTTTTTSSTTLTTAPVVTTTSTTLKPHPITTTTTIPSSTTTTSTTSTTSTSTTLKGKAVEVIVEALAKVTIRYSFNEGKWETLTLNTDQVHTFRSRSPVKFEFTDGGVVNIIVNGKDIGTPGAKQKPLNISYP